MVSRQALMASARKIEGTEFDRTRRRRLEAARLQKCLHQFWSRQVPLWPAAEIRRSGDRSRQFRGRAFGRHCRRPARDQDRRRRLPVQRAQI